MTSAQLTELAKPFPKQYLGKDDRGNDAVDHTVVTQRLLQILGPYSQEVREVLRSQVDPMKTRSGKEYPGGHFVTGVVIRLHLNIDGREVYIDETGGCENAAMKDGDGERLKHAISDAIKRCAMRLSLGLHMWAQEHYFLYTVLSRESEEVPPPDGNGDGGEVVEVPVGVGEDGPAPTDQPDPEDENGKGEGPPPPATDRERLTRRFHAQIRDLELNYERNVRPTLEKVYGKTLSQLSEGELSKLVGTLDTPSGAGRFRAKAMMVSAGDGE